jgi:hypothetical protein
VNAPTILALAQLAPSDAIRLAARERGLSCWRGRSHEVMPPTMRSCTHKVANVCGRIPARQAQLPRHNEKKPCFRTSFDRHRSHVKLNLELACGVNFPANRGLACCVCSSTRTRRYGDVAIASTADEAIPVPASTTTSRRPPRAHAAWWSSPPPAPPTSPAPNAGTAAACGLNSARPVVAIALSRIHS